MALGAAALRLKGQGVVDPGIAAGDFNGDGVGDLAITFREKTGATWREGVRIWLGKAGETAEVRRSRWAASIADGSTADVVNRLKFSSAGVLGSRML